MSGRPYDFVVLGATGFTGRRVARRLEQTGEQMGVRWAVAGRDEARVTQMLLDMRINADVLVADVNNYDSLLLMARETRVVLSCVGPYRHYGESVVSACVESGCHYVDVCGEPQFLETMAYRYGEEARELGVYIVGACGFDSVPSDMGVEFARRAIMPATLTAVDAYLDMQTGPKGGGIHFATYESAVYGIGDVGTLRQLRKCVAAPRLPVVGKQLKSKGAWHFKESLGKYAAPFPGADASVVRRSQRYLHANKSQTPVQFSMYFLINGWWSLFLTGFLGAIFNLLAARSWGRDLLLHHPRFFTNGLVSHQGPTEEQMKDTTFVTTLYGYGYNDPSQANKTTEHDRKITVKVAGPEPGYVATPIILIQCALTLLRDGDKLPSTGGVFSSAAAFADTDLIKRLQDNGIVFKTVE